MKHLKKIDLSFLLLVRAMAPKPQTKKATPKKTAAQKAAEDKKRRQSNMLGQLQNAKKKIAELEKQGVDQNDPTLRDLRIKEQFAEEYKSLGNDSQKKSEMLDLFEQDKTCKKWSSWVSKTVSKEDTEKSGGLQGWCSRFLDML